MVCRQKPSERKRPCGRPKISLEKKLIAKMARKGMKGEDMGGVAQQEGTGVSEDKLK